MWVTLIHVLSFKLGVPILRFEFNFRGEGGEIQVGRECKAVMRFLACKEAMV